MKRNLIAAHGHALAVLQKCLILFTMLLTVSLSARAEEFEVGNLRYSVLSETDRTVEVSKYVGEPVDVVEIPYIVENSGVTYSVTRIGMSAFQWCQSLASVTIPNSVTCIENSAFYGTSLTSVIIPNSVTNIGKEAFGWCRPLLSVTIPNSVTSIGERAFVACDSLVSVNIPNSVTSIGVAVFSSCTSLEEILVDAGNANYSSDNGILYNKDKTELIQCPGAKKEVTIPNSVMSIWDFAFSYCTYLRSVTIPNSVTSIGEKAFALCTSLSSVTIPSTVTNIGSSAFRNCTSLKTIYSESTTPPQAGRNAFAEVPTDAVVYVPEGTIGAYSVANEWNRFTDFREKTPTGVNELAVDHKGGPVDVYNMQGMLVKANASQADVDGLAPGLYIIGGRKVLVK